MSDNVLAKARLKMTPGDAVRVMRDLQEMTQADLAAASGIPQPAISSIESGRSALGVDRAEKLARALHVHPAVLLWPSWEPERASAKEPIKEIVTAKLVMKPLKRSRIESQPAAQKMRSHSQSKRVGR